jgi:hypothetical protein
MNRKCHICLLLLVSVFFLAGCSTQSYRAYKQPELFHPRTAIAKSLLKQTFQGQVSIMGPSEDLIPGDEGDYDISLYDNSPGQGNPIITILPSNVGALKRSDNGWVLTVEREKLKNLAAIEVRIQGRAARLLTPVQAVSQGQFAQQTFYVSDLKGENILSEDTTTFKTDLLQVHTRSVNRADAQPFVLITYYGSVPAGKKLEQILAVRTEPSDIVRSITSTNTDLYVQLERDALVDKAFEIQVEVLDAATTSFTDKMDQGKLAFRKIEVREGTRLEVSMQAASKANTADSFGNTFADCFIACEVQIANPNPNSVLVYSASLEIEVRYLMAKADAVKMFGKEAIEHPEIADLMKDKDGRLFDYLDFTEFRRPMGYSDILAIFEFQKKSDPRQKTIDVLKSVGELAAAAGVFVSGTTYPQVVSIFTGVFTPELEKRLLWDLLLHAKNLQDRSLQGIEEIPAYSSIHKVVFFPRRPIYGVVPTVPVYIDELLTWETLNIRVTGTMINKTATIESKTKD